MKFPGPISTIAFFLLGGLGSSAENTDTGQRLELIDPAGIGFSLPGITIDASFGGVADFSDGSGQVQTQDFRFSAPLWGTKINDIRLGAGLNYRLTELEFSNIPDLDRLSLHTVNFRMASFWAPENSKWWSLAFVSPGVRSDMESVSDRDFVLSALGLVGYRIRPNLVLAGGLYADFDSDATTIYPALGVVWHPGPYIVQLTPPFAVLGWKVTERYTFSLSAYPSGGSWESDRSDYQRLELAGWQTAAMLSYKATDKFTISLRAGYTVGGSLELRDANDHHLVDKNLENSPFVALSLRLALF